MKTEEDKTITGHTITIDDPRMVANLDFLQRVSALYTPQMVMRTLMEDQLELSARRHKRRIVNDYKYGIVTEERYTELMGNPPSEDLKKESKAIQLQDAKVRYATGEIDADEYGSIVKEPPTAELKHKRENMRKYLDNLSTFARQGAHMFNEREVERMFWKAFSMGITKEDCADPLGKDFSV